MQKNNSRAILFGLSAVLLWSTVATAFKISLQFVSPTYLVALASFFSLLCLLGILGVQKQLPIVLSELKQHWQRSLIMGLINPFIYYLILFQAYSLLPAQEAQAINYTWALCLSLLAVPLLKQKLSFGDIVGSLLCYTGVLFIASRGDFSSFHFTSLSGVLLALSSTVLWAFYWILGVKDKREPIMGLALNFLIATPIAFLWAYSQEGLPIIAWQAWVGAAYIGAFEMGFTFVLWLLAMRLTESTSKIANLIFLSPIVSLFLIYFILNETILSSTLWGLAFIMSGLIAQKLYAKRA